MSRTLTLTTSSRLATWSRAASSRPIRTRPSRMAMVAGTAPRERTMSSTSVATRRFSGRGRPWLMMVDSRATTAAPAARASAHLLGDLDEARIEGLRGAGALRCGGRHGPDPTRASVLAAAVGVASRAVARTRMGSVSDPGYPQAWEADVLLRDGHPIHLRPITPGDGDALRAFHSVAVRPDGLLPLLLRQAGADRRATSSTSPTSTTSRAWPSWPSIATTSSASAASTPWATGRPRWPSSSATTCRASGSGRCCSSTSPPPAASGASRASWPRCCRPTAGCCRPSAQAGYALTQQREDDVLAVAFDIEPTAASLAVMSAREHRAEARSMARMLRPQSVAVVGASRTGTGLGSLILRHLVEGGFTRRAGGRAPGGRRAGGRPLRPVALPTSTRRSTSSSWSSRPARCADVIADAAAAEVHGLVVVSSGSATRCSRRARRRRSPAPACAWSARTPSASSTPTPRCGSTPPWCPPCRSAAAWASSASPGRWASSILERFSPARASACRRFVSAGNRADVSGNDLLQYWEEDPAHRPRAALPRDHRQRPQVRAHRPSAGPQQARGHGPQRGSGTRASPRARRRAHRRCSSAPSTRSSPTAASSSSTASTGMIDVGPGRRRPAAADGTDAVAVIGNSDALAVMAVERPCEARPGLARRTRRLRPAGVC